MLGLHSPAWCLRDQLGLWGFLLSWVKAKWPNQGPFLPQVLSVISVGLDVTLSIKVSSVWQGEVGEPICAALQTPSHAAASRLCLPPVLFPQKKRGLAHPTNPWDEADQDTTP